MGKRGEVENLPIVFLRTEIKQGCIFWKIFSSHRGRGKYQPMSFGGKMYRERREKRKM
jgi:hypothetical protein